MPNGDRKVSRGEPLRITAEVWNTLLEIVKDYKRGGIGQINERILGQPLRPNLTVYVRNQTEELWNDVFNIVRLSGTAITLDATTQYQFNINPTFDAFIPESTNDIIAITQQPTTYAGPSSSSGDSSPEIVEIPNAVVPAIIKGVAVCRVLLHDAAHTWANPVPGEIGYLESTAGLGQARIIDYVAYESDTVLAVVDLVGPQSPNLTYAYANDASIAGLNPIPDTPSDIVGTELVLPEPGYYQVTYQIPIVMRVGTVASRTAPNNGQFVNLYVDDPDALVGWPAPTMMYIDGPDVSNRTIVQRVHWHFIHATNGTTIKVQAEKVGTWTDCYVPDGSISPDPTASGFRASAIKISVNPPFGWA